MSKLPKYAAQMTREALTMEEYEATWFKDNDPQSSFCLTLDQLTAAQASEAPPIGRNSVAAHGYHVLFTLDTYLAYARQENPEPNWESSWAKQTVTDEEWADLRKKLHERSEEWAQVVENMGDHLDNDDIARGMIASVAHFAYHLGAVRQIAANYVQHRD